MTSASRGGPTISPQFAEGRRFRSSRVPSARRWCDQSVVFPAVVRPKCWVSSGAWPALCVTNVLCSCASFFRSLWGLVVFGWNFRHRLAYYILYYIIYYIHEASISSMPLTSGAVIAQRSVIVWMFENDIFFSSGNYVFSKLGPLFCQMHWFPPILGCVWQLWIWTIFWS